MVPYNVRYKIDGVVVAVHSSSTPLPSKGDAVIWDGVIATKVSDITWLLSSDSMIIEITLSLD